MPIAKGTARNAKATITASTVGLATIVLLAAWWFRSPPPMGADEEVVKAVDALFTAVTSRDDKRLADCRQRLLALKDSGQLPERASAYLDQIIGQARAGHWESAAESLYGFIRAQMKFGEHQ